MSIAAAPRLKRILFVDDEPHLLSSLECMLHRFRSVWDMAFASSAEAALDLVHKNNFDVVVSDLHLRGMDGLGLLSAVKEHSPGATRIILSGSGDQEAVMRAVGVAHQFMAKPCNADELKATIQRSLTLRELLASERVVRVAGRLGALPPVPTLYLEIQRVLAQPGASIEQVGELVARDVAMSAKVLQLVHSAFFGLARRMTSAAEATKYLGLETLSALVLSAHVFEQSSTVTSERLELLWKHSLRCAAYARAIARLEGLDVKAADQAFLAGMLHEVGLLLLLNERADELSEAWKYARRFGLPPSEGERRVIGATHAALGAYLMGIWGLPDSVVQALAFHHSPSALQHTGFCALTAVHVATAFDCGPEGSAFGETERELDLPYLERLGLAARLPAWRAECARIEEVRTP